jgi:hypothetical protein
LGVDQVDLAFEEFWAAFPPARKRDKGRARQDFRKVVSGKHKVGRASAQTLITAAKAYAQSRPDPKYVPLPSTWLNGGRWMDDVCQPKGDPISDAERTDWVRQLNAVAEFAAVEADS